MSMFTTQDDRRQTFFMTGNELKKLNRKQLLELLLKQSLRVEELEKKLEEVQKQLDEQNLFKEMELRCEQREAEAQLKIVEATRIIAEAEQAIEAAKGVVQTKPAVKEPLAEETVTSEPAQVEQETEESNNDVLDAFFLGVIGHK